MAKKSWLVDLGHSLKEKEWAFLEPFKKSRIGLPIDRIVELENYEPKLLEKMLDQGHLYKDRYGRIAHKDRSGFDDLS